MKYKIILGVIFSLLLLSSFPSFCSEVDDNKLMSEIKEAYLKGEYGKVVSLTEEGLTGRKLPDGSNLEKENRWKGVLYYFQGLGLSKLQSFEKAKESFEKAVLSGFNQAPDIYYEMGQAGYASSDFTKAKKAFVKSIKNRYLVSSSYYYLGYISQLLEQYQVAVKYYLSIENASKDVVQAANFQMGEIFLTLSEREKLPKEKIKKFVLPQYERALEIDPPSPLGKEIKQKIQELKTKYDLDENKMVNGRMLPEKRYTIILKESTVYDSNLVYEADEANPKMASKDTIYLKSDLYGKYRWSFFRRWQISPQARITNTYHYLNRELSAIKKNDSYTIEPKLEQSFEHTFNHKMATFLFEYEYNYTAKDERAESNLNFYSRYMAFSIGEKFNPFKEGSNFGEVTIKGKNKSYTPVDKKSETVTNSLSTSLSYIFPSKQLMLFLVSLDLTRGKVKKSSDQDVLTTRVDYVIPKLFLESNCNFALNYTLTDPKSERPSRGLEQSINPSLTLSHNFTPDFEYSGRYEFTKALSKNKSSYAYTKHVFGLDFQFTF